MVTSASTLPEFDQYAPAYTDMLDDPIRKQFSKDPLHFHRRKWYLLRDMLEGAGRRVSAQRWLDVGCGQGDLLQLAGPHFAQATGCDPSSVMISRSNSFRVEHQPSFSRLPFKDASVDLVTAVCVYHHVHGAARAQLLEEMKRVLSPGGLCCILEHNPRNPITRAIVRRCPVDVDAELLPAEEVSDLLQVAGFKTVSTNYFLYLPETIFNRVGRVEKLLRKVPFGGQYAVLAQAPR
ncbi:MAG: methyltransferase domain-containing protein [Acidobacteriota bacterium]